MWIKLELVRVFFLYCSTKPSKSKLVLSFDEQEYNFGNNLVLVQYH